MEPDNQKKNVLYFVGGDGTAVPCGEIRSIEMTEPENPFGEPYSLGMDLLSNAFAQAELSAYFTAEEFRKLFKVFGIKRKILADRRRMECARRYRERKAVKRAKMEMRRKVGGTNGRT